MLAGHVGVVRRCCLPDCARASTIEPILARHIGATR
jgi:hypothetical protein